MVERQAIDCPHCNGLGLVRGHYAQHKLVRECPKCEGWGWVAIQVAGKTAVCGDASSREWSPGDRESDAAVRSRARPHGI